MELTCGAFLLANRKWLRGQGALKMKVWVRVLVSPAEGNPQKPLEFFGDLYPTRPMVGRKRSGRKEASWHPMSSVQIPEEGQKF